MKKSLMFVMGIILVLAAVIAGGCAAPATTPTTAPTSSPTSAPPAVQNIELKLAFPYPPMDELAWAANYVAAELEKRTNGKAKITVYPAGALGKMPESVDMLDKEIADIVLFAPSAVPKICRIQDAITLPTFRVPNRWLAQQTMYTLYYEGLLDKELSGYKPLMWVGTETSSFAFKKKVTTLEELQKLQMRAPAGLETQVVEALGVTVVSMPVTDVYMALDRGMVDGAKGMPGSFLGNKLQEVAHYYLWIPLGGGANIFLMTEKKWDSLSADIQVTLQELCNEASYLFLKEMDKQAPTSQAKLKAAGVEIYSLSSAEEQRWYSLMAKVTDKWLADSEAAGFPAKEAADVITRTVTRFLEQ